MIGLGTLEEGGGPLNGGLSLSNRFSAEITDPAVPYQIRMVIGARGGWLECEAIQVFALPDGAPVTAMAIRTMAVSRYMARVREELGRAAGAFLITKEVSRTEHSVTRSLVDSTSWDAMDYAQRRRGAQLTTHVVAEAYRAALNDPQQQMRPTAAVAERLNASRGHISRLLTAARREGLPGLGPARSSADPRNRGKTAGEPTPVEAGHTAAAETAASEPPPRPVPPEIAEWMKPLVPPHESQD
ncbi:MAG: hypothetical protein ABJB47_13245 [Actinomycetota bacterium]